MMRHQTVIDKKTLRMCIICNKKAEKRELFRVIYSDGFFIDFKQNFNARGRYICKDICCVNIINKKNILRSFRLRDLSDIEVEKLIHELRCSLAEADM